MHTLLPLSPSALAHELHAAGFRPPANLQPEALFDCVDALRRTQRHEKSGLRSAPVRLVIDRADGQTEFHIVPPPVGPALDVWEGTDPAIVRALIQFS